MSTDARTTRRMTTMGLAVAVATSATPIASAERRTSADPRGDVVAVRIDWGPNLEHLATRRPSRSHGDIVALEARHTHDRVVAVLRFRDIRADGTMGHTVVLQTAERRRTVYLTTRGGSVLGTDTGRCDDLRSRVLIERDLVRLSVPRGCLDDPRWVRVGAETTTSAKRADFHYDDAQRRGHDDRDWGFEGPALGPRLHRAP